MGIWGLALVTLSACGAVQSNSPVVEKISEDTMQEIADFSAPAQPTVEGSFSKIIGANNLVPIKADGSNIDSNLRPYLNAVGLVVLAGGGVCTGTHIGNGFVLTAGHCFFNESHIGARVIENRDCIGTSVRFGYRGSPKTGNPSPLVVGAGNCTKIVYAEHSNAKDFAIIRLDRAPKSFIPLVAGGRKPTAGMKITILGYPQGRPLEWSQYCALRTFSTIRVDAASSMFVYNCDTEPGNSGSAVLAIASDGKPYVVGIHNGAPQSQSMEFNFATFLNDARSTLKLKGFDLDRAVMTVGM